MIGKSLKRLGRTATFGIAILGGAAAAAAPAAAQTIGYADAIAILAKSCGKDIEKHCKGINLGGGRIEACIAEKPGISANCKTDLVQVQALLAARAAAQASVSELCNRDAQQFCKLTKPGKGNILNCLLKAAPSVSEKCNAAIDAAGYR
jgi:hypothetical protein